MQLQPYGAGGNNHITVFDLYNGMRDREQRHYEAFSIVLERAYSRIRKCASVNRYDCVFDVPEIVIGKPIFDVNKCTRFIMNNLMHNGFKVEYVFPRYLNISWDVTGRRSSHIDDVSRLTPEKVGIDRGAESSAAYDALLRRREAPIHPPPSGKKGGSRPKAGAPTGAQTGSSFRPIGEFKPSGKFRLRM